MYVTIPFFLHKMLASHRQPTFRDSRWTNYSNPGQLYPPRPPNFKVVVFFQGLRRVDKTNQTPQHDISRTHSLTLTFGEGGVFQSFPRGLNILSIYGMLVYQRVYVLKTSAALPTFKSILQYYRCDLSYYWRQTYCNF